MDVHLRSTTVCALDAETGEAVTRRFPGNPWGEIAGWMDGFPEGVDDMPGADRDGFNGRPRRPIASGRRGHCGS